MRTRTSQSGRRAAAAVEAAFVIGSLLTFLFAIFEYGRYVMIRHVVDNAAREGARQAVTANTWDTNSQYYATTADIQHTVMAALGGLDTALTLSGPPQVYLADAAGNNIGPWYNAQVGQNIAVEIDATYTPMMPTFGFLPSSVPVFAKALMRSEAN